MEKIFVYIRPKDGGFISPFLLAKFIEQNLGPIESAKNTKDGLLTKLNEHQINKLNGAMIAGKTMEVIANDKLNTSRGVMFYPAFKYLPNEDIITSLSSAGVTDISRILKKGNNTTNEIGTTEGRINTGLFIITFRKPKLPHNIKICFENIAINPYYPNPMKCQNCHNYGHKKLNCRKDKVCGNCGDIFHEVCPNQPKCINCNESHPAWNNKCPIWNNEKSIIKYAIDFEVSFKEARQRHQINTNLNSYANILRTPEQQNSEVNILKEEIRELKKIINQLQQQTPRPSTSAVHKQPAQDHLDQIRNSLQQQQQKQQQKQQPQEKQQLPQIQQQPQQSTHHHPTTCDNDTMETTPPSDLQSYTPNTTPTFPPPKTQRTPPKNDPKRPKRN